MGDEKGKIANWRLSVTKQSQTDENNKHGENLITRKIVTKSSSCYSIKVKKSRRKRSACIHWKENIFTQCFSCYFFFFWQFLSLEKGPPSFSSIQSPSDRVITRANYEGFIIMLPSTRTKASGLLTHKNEAVSALGQPGFLTYYDGTTTGQGEQWGTLSVLPIGKANHYFHRTD